MYVIYKTTCKINSKIYVGQHKTEILEDGYLGSGKLIRRAVEKYGKENFEREILEIVHTFQDARVREEHYIELYESTNPNIGYNITKFAWGGQPLTEEAKQKISRKLKGRKLSTETKQKLSKPKPERTVEHKENMSKSRSGKSWYHNPLTNESKCFSKLEFVPDEWIKGRPDSHFNNTRSEEANRKRSEKLSGLKKTVDTRLKISNSLLGHNVSQETREKLREATRKHYEKIGKYSQDQGNQEN